MTLQLKILQNSYRAFSRLYNDEGSSADCDVQFWHPLPQDGFLAAGDVCEASPSDWLYETYAPLGQVILLAADPSSPDDVRCPLDFTLLWSDDGSGALLQGALWAMVPPDGYTALGHCCSFSRSGPPPKPNPREYACVKSSLVSQGTAGAQIWNSAGSGADTDVGVYNPTSSVLYVDLHTFWTIPGSLGPPSPLATAVLPTTSVTLL